ncbi:O-antigen ligase family protein [Kamptonema cortianum]|nr:O-antigen ligase family protein [Kamptonema cortianum]
MTYYYGDNLRFDLWFDNPNHAGILLVSALPLVWWALLRARAIQAKTRRVLVLASLWILQAGLIYLLAATYSRGAFLAFVIAGLYWGWRGRRQQESRIQNSESRMTNDGGAVKNGTDHLPLPTANSAATAASATTSHPAPSTSHSTATAVAISFVLFGVFLLLNGGGFRVAEGLGGQDDSVGNRLIVWQGGLAMIAENPGGAGYGRSGDVFMQYYQPEGMRTGYKSLVSTWLTLMAEGGVIPFFLATAFFVFVWAFPTRPTAMNRACRSVIIAFVIAAAFTNMTPLWSLWILPGAAFIILGTHAVGSMTGRRQDFPRGMRYRTPGMIAVATAVGGMALVMGTGQGLLQSREWKVTDHRSEGTVTLSARNSDTPQRPRWLIVVDPGVWGGHYGHYLRQLAREKGVDAVITTRRRAQVNAPIDRVIISGNHAGDLSVWRESFPQAQDYTVVIPALPAGESGPNGDTRLHVILGGMNPLPHPSWREKAGGKILVLDGIDQQMNWAWEEVREFLLTPPG